MPEAHGDRTQPATTDPGANIPIASVPNLRDLGGWPTKDGGRVRRGLLYRSTELNKLQGADMDAFAKLGIRTVYDLRTEAERTAQPDRVPEGTEQIVCDVYADSVNAAPAREKELLSDPKAAAAMLGGGKAETMFDKGYREIVSLPSALDAYHRFFSDLAEERHRPALFHCTTGKDRTGWAAAATLTFLGVSKDDVMKDYLLTNDDLLPALKPVFDQFAAAGGDPKLLEPVAGVERQYLEAAFDEMRKKFGSFEGYFTKGLRIDAATQQRLRAAFTEGGAA